MNFTQFEKNPVEILKTKTKTKKKQKKVSTEDDLKELFLLINRLTRRVEKLEKRILKINKNK